MPEEQLRIAVFIDFDNIQIGVRSTLTKDFDVSAVLEALKERGEVISKIAYGNWKRHGNYSRTLSEQAVQMVQRDPTPRGDKNGADINLALDALEMAFTKPHINAYAIVGGDSDFIALVEKLKQYNKAVFVVGGRGFTSTILQKNCREFISYENLVRQPEPASRTPVAPRRPVRRGEPLPLETALPLMERALKVLAEREHQPLLGLVKSTMLQLDSTFSERDYGSGSFLDFAQKMAGAGFVQIDRVGSNYAVKLPERPAPAPAPLPQPEESAAPTESAAAHTASDGPAGAATPESPAPLPGRGPRRRRRSPANRPLPVAVRAETQPAFEVAAQAPTEEPAPAPASARRRAGSRRRRGSRAPAGNTH